MKTLCFPDNESFINEVIDTYEDVKNDDEYNSVDIIAKYDKAKEIISDLVNAGFNISYISDFADPSFNKYNDAYVVGLFEDEIWCERAKKDTGYICLDSDVTYILGDCNSKIISNIGTKFKYEVCICDDDNDDCDDCCENCESCDLELSKDKNENKNAHGFTASKSDGNSYMSYSFYSSDELSHEDIKEMLKIFGF